MRIISKEEFLSLPAGILYAKYNIEGVGEFGPLYIKGETWTRDFICARLADWDFGDFLESVEELEKNGLPVSCEEYGRDGLYEPNERFIVFDKEDVKTIIRALQSLLDE